MKSFKGYQSPWVLALLLLTGVILGSILGEVLGKMVPILGIGRTIGFVQPVVLDLNVITLTLGLKIKLNLASILGLLSAVLLYRKI